MSRTTLAAAAGMGATALLTVGLLAAPAYAGDAPVPGTPECTTAVDGDSLVVAANLAVTNAPAGTTDEALAALKAAVDAQVTAATKRLCTGVAVTDPTTEPTTTTPAPSGGSGQFEDKDCSDFANQRAAQAFYDANTTSSNPDPAQLDADGNGQACEDFVAAANPSTTVIVPVNPTQDDGSVASGGQVRDVPSGSASTGE